MCAARYLQIPVVEWLSVADAIAYIEMAMDCDRLSALRQLRTAIGNGRLSVRWADPQSEVDVPPVDREFWNEASIRMDEGGLVLFQAVGIEFETDPNSSTVVKALKKTTPRFRGLLIARRALHEAWPQRANMMPPRDDEPRGPVIRAKREAIRERARELYAARAVDPPNMREAEEQIRKSVRGATRTRIREVLHEDEFARQRRPSGVRRNNKLRRKV